MRLDHIIAVVPDLAASHDRLLSLGFDEAWPPGPFWPHAITSGAALGGVNLELYQPLSSAAQPHIESLVLAPDSLEEGSAYLRGHGLTYQIKKKVEPDPQLLALRGFPETMQKVPQEICTNQLPVEPPYPFFLCSYVPFLRDRLAPERFAAPRGAVSGLLIHSPTPDRVRKLFGEVINVEVVEAAVSEVREILFTDGSRLSIEDL